MTPDGLQCLALLQFGGGAKLFLPMNQTNPTHMSEYTKQATELSINLHESIDTMRLPAETKIKLDALGQCLRSLLETIENEPDNATA